jgi:hypothetical protein
MAGLVPAIHALPVLKEVDARHKAGHYEAAEPCPSPHDCPPDGPFEALASRRA